MNPDTPIMSMIREDLHDHDIEAHHQMRASSPLRSSSPPQRRPAMTSHRPRGRGSSREGTQRVRKRRSSVKRDRNAMTEQMRIDQRRNYLSLFSLLSLFFLSVLDPRLSSD